MNTWFRRAVGTVGIAGGVLLLGAGTAHAADSAPVAMDPQQLHGLFDDLLTPAGGPNNTSLSLAQGNRTGLPTDSLTSAPVPGVLGSLPINDVARTRGLGGLGTGTESAPAAAGPLGTPQLPLVDDLFGSLNSPTNGISTSDLSANPTNALPTTTNKAVNILPAQAAEAVKGKHRAVPNMLGDDLVDQSATEAAPAGGLGGLPVVGGLTGGGLPGLSGLPGLGSGGLPGGGLTGGGLPGLGGGLPVVGQLPGTSAIPANSLLPTSSLTGGAARTARPRTDSMDRPAATESLTEGLAEGLPAPVSALPVRDLPAANLPSSAPDTSLPTGRIPTSVLSTKTLPTRNLANGLPTGSLPAGLPTGSLPAGLPTGSLPAGLPTGSLPAGLPTGSLPAALPTTGLPTTGLPTGSLPTNSLPVFDSVRQLPLVGSLGALPGQAGATRTQSTVGRHRAAPVVNDAPESQFGVQPKITPSAVRDLPIFGSVLRQLPTDQLGSLPLAGGMFG